MHLINNITVVHINLNMGATSIWLHIKCKKESIFIHIQVNSSLICQKLMRNRRIDQVSCLSACQGLWPPCLHSTLPYHMGAGFAFCAFLFQNHLTEHYFCFSVTKQKEAANCSQVCVRIMNYLIMGLFGLILLAE